jgi:hypothetical protein
MTIADLDLLLRYIYGDPEPLYAITAKYATEGKLQWPA